MQNKLILFLFILMFVVGCEHTNNTLTKNNSLVPNDEYSINNANPNIIDLKVSNGIKEIENSYLRFKDSLHKDYTEKEQCLRNMPFTRYNYISGIILLIIAFLGFLGFKSYIDFYKAQTELRSFADTTMNTFKGIEQEVKNKEEGLHAKYGFITEDATVETYSDMDKAKFLDYDHQIYFFHTYLPITKNFALYKESLFKLGMYFLWDRKYDRAILRFEEIENIQKIEAREMSSINRIIKSVRGGEDYKTLLGTKTHRYYNAFGTACLYYAWSIKDTSKEEHIKYVDRASIYFTRSIAIDSKFSHPCFRLGQLHSLTYKEDDHTAIDYYKQVFGKEPKIIKIGETNIDIRWPAYRNMACCLIRLNKDKLGDVNILKEITDLLENIPENESYWKNIAEDSVLAKIKGTPQWHALINKKYPSLVQNA